MSDVKRGVVLSEGDISPGDERFGRNEIVHGVAGYSLGLGLAVLLTIVSFFVAGTTLVWRPSIPVALFVLAVAQIGIHLVFFLHITTGPDNTNNVMALAYGVLIVFLVIGGSIWIMSHMNEQHDAAAERNPAAAAMKLVITGAAGNLGTKLRRHFEGLGWELALLDRRNGGDAAIRECDLATWDDAWVRHFADADAVAHFAASPSPGIDWATAQRENIDLTLNVYEAAARQRAKRVIFASSNWVMAGHRFGTEKLTTDGAPYPVNPYGVSKLVGERLGRSYSERWGLTVICFRIGYIQRDTNEPGPQMGWGLWGQQMWLSNRDFCTAWENAATVAHRGQFHVLNLMSRNEGMRWDLEAARAAIGYVPEDSVAAAGDRGDAPRDRGRAASPFAGRERRRPCPVRPLVIRRRRPAPRRALPG